MTPLVRNIIMIALAVVIVLGIGGGVFLVVTTLSNAKRAAIDAYENAKNEEESLVYEQFYSVSYNLSEARYHTENQVTMTVDGICNESQLEVLRVSDSLLVESDTGSWVSILGHGVYTVDLSQCEFVTDATRQYVLVRVPSPKLSSVAVDNVDAPFGNNTTLDKWISEFKGNTSEGVNAAIKDRAEAQAQIEYELASNQSYLNQARDSAKRILTKLVKDLNPKWKNLTVEIEFMD